MTYSDISLEEAIKLALLRGAIYFLARPERYWFYTDEIENVLGFKPRRRVVLHYSKISRKVVEYDELFVDTEYKRPIQELIEELKLCGSAM